MFKFVQVLSDSVKSGQKFQITGISKADAKKISTIFSTGRSSSSEQVLKIEVDYNQHKVIINNESINNFVLKSGLRFEFLILVGDDSFNIFINGIKIREYKCQINQIRSVTVLGDVDHLLKLNHLIEDYQKSGNTLALESYTPINYQPGHVIVISGECTEEFYITFTEKYTGRELIHFNVRFGEQSVVMNTVDPETNWWTDFEDRPEEFPFEVNKPFKIAFAFTETDFKVAVDGTHLMDFELARVTFNDDQSIWDMLCGFRVINREAGTVTTITSVEHIKMEPLCEGYENLCSRNQA